MSRQPSSGLAQPDGVFAPGRRLLTVGLVFVVTLVAAEALAVSTVVPLVEQELGQVELLGWLFSAYYIANLVGIVVAVRVTDRVHAVVPLAIGLVLFVAGLTADGLAPSMPALVAARTVQGLGGGVLPATAYVCIARGYPDRFRPRMFALLSTAWVLPALLGPALASWIGETAGWRWVFLGLLPVVALAGALALLGVRMLHRPASSVSGASVPLALVLALGTTLLLGGMQAGDPAPRAIAVVAGVVAAIVAIRRLSPAGTLVAGSGLPSTIALKWLFMFAFFATSTYIPYALVTVRESSTLFGGAVVTVVSLMWTAGAWVQERRIHRSGPRPLVRAGLLLVAASAAGLALVVVISLPIASAFAFGAVAGLGAGLTFGPLSAAGLAAAEPGREGQASMGQQIAEVLGVALGTGTAGVVIALGHELGWSASTQMGIVFAMTATVCTGASLLASRLPPTVRDRGPREQPATFSA